MGGGNGKHGRILTLKEVRRMKKRGYQAERDLVKKLRDLGFKSVRIPVSASSGEPLPDVFAVKSDCIMAFEVKAPRDRRAYFPRDQVKKLFDFLSMFDSYPNRIAVLVAKFPRKWIFRRIDVIDDYFISADEVSNLRLEAI
ncbi:MAG: endonuclease [Candidatus Bathyarchaeia archaeon]